MKKIFLLSIAGLFILSCTSNPDVEKSREASDSAAAPTDSDAPSANSDTTAPSAASQSTPVNK